MQRTLDFAAYQCGVRLIRLFSRGVRGELNDGIELRIDFRDLFEMGLHDNPGAELLRADGACEFAGRFQRNIVARCRRRFRRIDQRSVPGGSDHACNRSRAQKIPAPHFVAHLLNPSVTTSHFTKANSVSSQHASLRRGGISSISGK